MDRYPLDLVPSSVKEFHVPSPQTGAGGFMSHRCWSITRFVGSIFAALLGGSKAATAAMGQVQVLNAPAGVTALVDVVVVLMDTEHVLAQYTVLIQNGRIMTLGPSAKVRIPEGAARIDGGRWLPRTEIDRRLAEIAAAAAP